MVDESRPRAAADTATNARRDLIVLLDGTSNTISGGVEDTNVLRLLAYLNRHRSASRLIYYHPGVGSPDAVPPTGLIDWFKRTRERVSGLALGRGVYEDVEQAYLFLMNNWRDDNDRIYVFGFSRGAFTARAVVGIVNLFGILRPEHSPLVPAVVRVYFSLPDRVGSWYETVMRTLHSRFGRKGKASAEIGGHSDVAPNVSRDPRDVIADQIRDLFTNVSVGWANVYWVGVWDTVESVGLPGPLSQSNPSTATLKPRVLNVRHALAFDEHRWTFVPRLYEEPGDVDNGRQTLKQRWFPGAHCDVGGSYPIDKSGLSEASLKWMIDEVSGPNQLDLPPYQPHPQAKRVYHDATYDLPWWALAGLTVRSMRPRTSTTPKQSIKIIPASPSSTVEETVWAAPRAWWPVIVALLGGLLLLGLPALMRTHRCVLCQWTPARHLDAVHETLAGIGDSLLQLDFGGLTGYLNPVAWSGVELGWVVLWDLAFILCWGYLLARIASRAFAWMVGVRGPTSTGPALRVLGMMPLLLIASSASRDLLVVLAVFMPQIDAYVLAAIFAYGARAVGFCAVLGLIGCVPLIALRLALAVPGVRTYRL